MVMGCDAEILVALQGLMSLDSTFVRIKMRTGSLEERKMAAKVEWFAKNRHLTLVTLLIGSACANEALVVVFERILGEAAALALSVTVVLVCCEIIPSAVFTGERQLEIGALMSPICSFLVGLLSPVAFPIAWFLDRWLGNHAEQGVRYKREELKEFIRMHGDDSETPEFIVSEPFPRGGVFARSTLRNRTSADIPFAYRGLFDTIPSPCSPSPTLELQTLHDTAKGKAEKEDDDSEEEVLEGGSGELDVDSSEVKQGSDVGLPLLVGAPRQRPDGTTPNQPPNERRSTLAVRSPLEVGLPLLCDAGVTPALRAWNANGTCASLTRDEIRVMEGVLELGQKTVQEVMVTTADVFCLSLEESLGLALLHDLARSGCSWVPVHEGQDKSRVIGLLPVKQVLHLHSQRVSDMSHLLEAPLLVHPQTSLLETLELLQGGSAPMALVSGGSMTAGHASSASMDQKRVHDCSEVARMKGIVTLDAVLGRMLRPTCSCNEVNFAPLEEEVPPLLLRSSGPNNHIGWAYAESVGTLAAETLSERTRWSPNNADTASVYRDAVDNV